MSVTSKPRFLLTSVKRDLDITLTELYSIADSSTTVKGIPILFIGGSWARRPLHAGIGYISVASKPRIWLSSVKGFLGSTMLAEFYSIAEYSTIEGGLKFSFLEVVGLDASYTPV